MAKLFDGLKALKDAYDTKLKEEGEAAVKDLFKDLFDKHPRLEGVIWTQFTPYFNDGDPCYFSVHDFDPIISPPEPTEGPLDYVSEEGREEESSDDSYDSDEDLYDDSYNWGERLYALRKSDDEDLKKIAYDLGDLNNEIPNDVLKKVFGDHCTIKATRDGFKVSECNHD